MKWFRKRKNRSLRFEDAARFNWALDTNKELRRGIAQLAEKLPMLTEDEYTQKALSLFSEAGLELTGDELKMLLALRRETDRMLLWQDGK